MLFRVLVYPRPLPRRRSVLAVAEAAAVVVGQARFAVVDAGPVGVVEGRGVAGRVEGDLGPSRRRDRLEERVVGPRVEVADVDAAARLRGTRTSQSLSLQPRISAALGAIPPILRRPIFSTRALEFSKLLSLVRPTGPIASS